MYSTLIKARRAFYDLSLFCACKMKEHKVLGLCMPCLGLLCTFIHGSLRFYLKNHNFDQVSDLFLKNKKQ